MSATAGGADGGYSPGLYAAGGGYAAPGFNAVRPDVGHADRAAAGFNADSSSISNPDANPGNAKGNAGGSQQWGRYYEPLYPAD